jgi:predicted phage terminase large subunit-like protein
LFSRRNDQKNGPIVVIMQRLHENDLVAEIQEKFGAENVELLNFPAIAQKDETYTITTPIEGTITYPWRVNDLLHPERLDRATLDRMRASMGPYYFSSQYLQSPTPIYGGMIDERWFPRYKPEEVENQSWDYVIQTWDTANKATELSDYSACGTWKIQKEETGQKELYLIDMFRAKLDYPALKRAVLQQREEFQAWTVLIEDKASGTQLIQELRPNGWGVAPYYGPPGADKIMRMHAACGVIESGHVHIPENAKWLPDFLSEVKAFPHGKYDDQVDSMSQLVDWLNQDEQYRRKRTWHTSTVHI